MCLPLLFIICCLIMDLVELKDVDKKDIIRNYAIWFGISMIFGMIYCAVIGYRPYGVLGLSLGSFLARMIFSKAPLGYFVSCGHVCFMGQYFGIVFYGIYLFTDK